MNFDKGLLIFRFPVLLTYNHIDFFPLYTYKTSFQDTELVFKTSIQDVQVVFKTSFQDAYVVCKMACQDA